MAIKAIINNTEKEIEQIKNSDEQDIDYVYSRIGDTEVEGEPPISIKSIGGELADYRIYGNTVGGESVGDLVESGEHAGEYKVPVTVEGKNLLPNTATSQTINGVAFTVNSDGSVTCNGTASDIVIYVISSEAFSLPVGRYKLNGAPTGGGQNYNFKLDVRVLPNSYYPDTGNGGQFSILQGERITLCRIVIYSGYTCDNLTFYPMIRKADIEDDTYEPYHAPVTTPIYLPEPIKMVGEEAEYIDYTEQKLHRVRKNLLQNQAVDREIEGVTFTVNSDGSITCNGTASDNTNSGSISSSSLPAGSYYLNGTPSGGSLSTYYMYVACYTESEIILYNDVGDGVSFTIDNSCNINVRIGIVSGCTCNNLTFYPMIRKADITDDTYEPYIVNTEVNTNLPALSTIKGTNILSVNTSIQPSNIYIKDSFDYKKVFTAIRTIEDELPLNYRNIEDNDSTLDNYRIYGNTVGGESVGDRTGNLFDYTKTNRQIHKLRNDDGTINTQTTQSNYFEYYIPVKPNTTYTVKTSTNCPSRIYFSDSQKQWLSRSDIIEASSMLNYRTFTIPNNCYFIQFQEFDDYRMDETTIILVEGSEVPASYEPYGYKVPVTVSNGTDTLTTPIYLPEQIKKVGDEAEYIDYGEQKMHRIGADDIDVTLPALPTLPGTNVLSVGTAVQPSSVYLKGKLKRTIYGWHVNPDISNSSNAVTYLKDAVGMTPAAMGSTTFNYGSWQNAFFMPKPCMLKSNGKVDYYLDPDDYTKKLNGTASDISNPNYDGNAMMQWPKIWFKYVKGVKEGQGYFYVANYKADGNYHCWCNYDSEDNEIDHFYTAIYNGTSFMNYSASKTYVVNDFAVYDNKLYKCNTAITTAQAFDSAKWNVVSNTAPAINKMRSLSGIRLTNNNGNAQTNTTTEVTRAGANNTTAAKEWYIETFGDRLLLNGLLVLMGKSLNTQAIFGRGLDSGSQSAKEAYITGALNDKGLFYGVTGNGNSAVKVFGMENFWGCGWHRIAGLITNNHAVKLKLTYGTKDGSTVIGYNQTGNGYIDNGTAPYSNGYVQKMSYNKYGFMPAVVTGGSQSTYYADYHYQNENYTGVIYALFGGGSGNGLNAGAFYLHLGSAPGSAHWNVAASLSCKPLL